MQTARRARIAVAGLGRMGQLHAANLATRVSTGLLAAVADAVEPRARRLGERYGVPWSTSVDGLLADPALDAIVVATPSALHPELVTRVAEAGRHIFCEKPLGLEVASSSAAVLAADAAGVGLQVGFQRRFDADWQALKAAVDAGAIGSLALFRCSHRNAAPPPDATALGGIFADMAVHDLDSARWLAGEVSELYAAEATAAGAAIVTLRFESGAAGVVDLHRSAGYGFECSAELVGSRATIRCGGLGRRGTTELLRDGSVTAPLTPDHAERHAAAYVAELEHFGAVAAGRAEPAATGHDAVAALHLAAVAERSVAAGAPLAAAEHAARAP